MTDQPDEGAPLDPATWRPPVARPDVPRELVRRNPVPPGGFISSETRPGPDPATVPSSATRLGVEDREARIARLQRTIDAQTLQLGSSWERLASRHDDLARTNRSQQLTGGVLAAFGSFGVVWNLAIERPSGALACLLLVIVGSVRYHRRGVPIEASRGVAADIRRELDAGRLPPEVYRERSAEITEGRP